MHPYRFGAKDDVAVAVPKARIAPEVLIFIQAALNAERWRFSYYRKCFFKKLERLSLSLPVRPDQTLDLSYMGRAVKAQGYWWFLQPRVASWRPARPVPAADESPPDDRQPDGKKGAS
jgi:hypothetical protein